MLLFFSAIGDGSIERRNFAFQELYRVLSSSGRAKGFVTIELKKKPPLIPRTLLWYILLNAISFFFFSVSFGGRGKREGRKDVTIPSENRFVVIVKRILCRAFFRLYKAFLRLQNTYTSSEFLPLSALPSRSGLKPYFLATSKKK